MSSRKPWLNLLRIALSLVAVALLIREVGGADLLAVLRTAQWPLLVLAWLLFLAGIVVRAFRWKALLDGLGLHPGFWRLLKLYFVGGFFNTFLPSGFGGDVVRVIELAQGQATSAAIGTVLVDRLTGILSLLALGLMVLPFAGELPVWLALGMAAVSLLGLDGGALLLEGRLLRRLTNRLPGALRLSGEGKLSQLYAAITGVGSGALWRALALSTLFNVLNIAVYWLCGLAVGIRLGLGFYFVVVPLLSLALLVPISVGGLGARDWVAQPMFRAVHVAESLTAGMTLSVWLVTAAAGLIGGILYLAEVLTGLGAFKGFSGGRT